MSHIASTIVMQSYHIASHTHTASHTAIVIPHGLARLSLTGRSVHGAAAPGSAFLPA